MRPHDGLRKDIIRTKVFEDYIRDHVESWYSIAARMKLDVEHMEDFILVTGCHLVKSWGVHPIVAYQSSHQVCPHSQYRPSVF